MITSELGWRSYHIVYHGDRDKVLLELVHPLVTDLWRKSCIDSFFFLRYALGGPHVRLRLRIRSGADQEIGMMLAKKAADFFARWPSTQPRSEELIRLDNEAILAGDGDDQEAPVYKDNTILPSPFHFETERYGGPTLLGASLDFFTLSSVQAILFIRSHREEPPARRYPRVMRLLARQALSFAVDTDDWTALLDYASRGWPQMTSIAARGNRIYEERSESFQHLLRLEVDDFIQALAPSSLRVWEVTAARWLAYAVAGAQHRVRRRIFDSHLHMTANRLGLLNPEEVYLGRLMQRAAFDLLAADSALRNRLRDTISGCSASSSISWKELQSLVPSALTKLCEETIPSGMISR